MANTEKSDVSRDDKELSSKEKSIDKCKDGKDEFMISHGSPLVEPPLSPTRCQEHTSDMSAGVSLDNAYNNESESSSDDAYSAPESDNENSGGQMACVEIGSHRTVLNVRSELLKKKIPFFENFFNARRLNFYEKYPELDPAGLKPLKLWIYGISIAKQKRNGCRTTKLFSLFAIAYRFEHESLQDETMECIVKETRESRDESRFLPEHVRFAYETTPEASKLRVFCAKSVAEALDEDNQFNWDREQASTLLDAIPELHVDISPDIISRFMNASTATDNTSYDHHQLTEVDDNFQPVEDTVGGDHTRDKRVFRSSSGSDEKRSSSADFDTDLSGKSPDSMSVQFTSPDSKSDEESGNNKRVKLSDDTDEEVCAVTRRSSDPGAMEARFHGGSSGSFTGELLEVTNGS